MNGEAAEATISRMLGERPIMLVGMMGVGKSSVGRRLATRLGMKFADADTEIELAANATIPEIFEEFGEAYFRDGERRVISRLISGGPRVIATGGGAFIQDETRDEIKSDAISVWLNADRDTILSRVRRRSNRPLLKGGNPADIIDNLMKERNPIYAEADIHIRSREVAHEIVVDEIVEAIAAHLQAEETPAEAEAHG